MAKASSPIRLQASLMQSAADTAKQFHRSMAAQIEYWADIGRQTSHLIDPNVLLSVTSGLAQIKIEDIKEKPISPKDVFEQLEKDRADGTLKQNSLKNNVQYQASKHYLGYLEQIDTNGSIQIGLFNNGTFTAIDPDHFER